MVTAMVWVGMHLVMGKFDQLDLRIYRMGAASLWHATGLYEATDPSSGLRFTYPPFAAALLLPTTLLPQTVAGFAMVGASCAALARLCHLSVTRIGGIPGLGYAASFWIVLTVALSCEPVVSTLSFGQVNLILAWLVVEDLTRVRGRGLGVGTGIAAAVKLVPAAFIVYLWWAGMRRAALGAALTFAAAGVLAAALFWSDSRAFWSGMFADAGHVGGIPYQANQSALGVVARAVGTETPTLWLYLPGIAALVWSLAMATWFARHADRGRGLILASLGGLLASPISWTHHWVWCIPLVCLLLCDVAAARPGARVLLSATLVVFTARTIWWPPSDNDAALGYSTVQQALAAAYPLLAVAVLIWHTDLLRRDPVARRELLRSGSRRLPLHAAEPPIAALRGPHSANAPKHAVGGSIVDERTSVAGRWPVPTSIWDSRIAVPGCLSMAVDGMAGQAGRQSH